ncbi:MAG: sulfotransferase domain-containing protein [Acidobacteriota bacterium]|nr:sulfotransferase domain-containing protein [Acidobacteriota bacterium]
MLPTFIVIGARKSGTSSLWEYLKGHPGIFVPEEEKEPKFFVEERGWGAGLEWYEGLFAGAREDQARGELSTDYTAFPLYTGVPARMKALLPDVRLVYVMRDPIEHLRSAYA